MRDLISVIVPTFNRSDLLIESIRSIWEQTYRPIEVLVIDDGSYDDTKVNIFNLKSNLEDNQFKIIYFYQNNQGSNFARNKGMELAKGAWIQFLDSDDLLEKNKFRKQIKALKETSSEVAFCNFKKITISNKIIYFKNSGNLLKRLSLGYSVHISTPLFKKSLLNNVKWNCKLFREQDKEFIYKAILKARKYVYVDSYLSIYRMHNKSQISKNYSKTKLETLENIKSDLNLLFNRKIKLKRFALFYIAIHILYLIYKHSKRSIKFLIFGRYALHYKD